MICQMETKLPKWFDGAKYKQGDIVANPFSGEEMYLDRDELSILITPAMLIA